MNYESTNIIYFIICKKYLEQYVCSAMKIKTRFGIHKFHIKILKKGWWDS